MSWFRRLAKPLLWVVAILSLSETIAAVRAFFTGPDLWAWVGALIWPVLFIGSFFALSVFEYAKMKKAGRIIHPNRLYERLIEPKD